VSPVRYELSSFIPEDGTPQSHRRENLKSYILQGVSASHPSADAVCLELLTVSLNEALTRTSVDPLRTCG
jgi:hypothetical protein